MNSHKKYQEGEMKRQPYLELPMTQHKAGVEIGCGMNGLTEIERSPEISWDQLNYSIHKKNLLTNCWGTVSAD